MIEYCTSAQCIRQAITHVAADNHILLYNIPFTIIYIIYTNPSWRRVCRHASVFSTVVRRRIVGGKGGWHCKLHCKICECDVCVLLCKWRCSRFSRFKRVDGFLYEQFEIGSGHTNTYYELGLRIVNPMTTMTTMN